MNKTILLVSAIWFLSPTVSADHVKIHFAGGSNPCPIYTEYKNNQGHTQNCINQSKQQADAVCARQGDTIEWRSSKKFVIEVIGVNWQPTYSANQKQATIVIPLGLPDSELKYTIFDENKTCVLDPRIIVNPSFTLSNPFVGD